MKKILFALSLGLHAPVSSPAGLVDLMNGGKAGAPLLPHQFQFLSTPPPATASLRLIDFWATWCKPCHESIPILNALQEKYSVRGLAVIGLSPEPIATVSAFLAKNKITYPVAVETTPSLHRSLKTKALPYCIFVSAEGKIVWRGQPSEIDHALVERLLPKQTSP